MGGALEALDDEFVGVEDGHRGAVRVLSHNASLADCSVRLGGWLHGIGPLLI